LLEGTIGFLNGVLDKQVEGFGVDALDVENVGWEFLRVPKGKDLFHLGDQRLDLGLP
jgi:hypothetical protein